MAVTEFAFASRNKRKKSCHKHTKEQIIVRNGRNGIKEDEEMGQIC
jgi:hypothetical protein